MLMVFLTCCSRFLLFLNNLKHIIHFTFSQSSYGLGDHIWNWKLLNKYHKKTTVPCAVIYDDADLFKTYIIFYKCHICDHHVLLYVLPYDHSIQFCFRIYVPIVFIVVSCPSVHVEYTVLGQLGAWNPSYSFHSQTYFLFGMQICIIVTHKVCFTKMHRVAFLSPIWALRHMHVFMLRPWYVICEKYSALMVHQERLINIIGLN